MPQHRIKLNQVNQTSCSPDEGTVNIECRDDEGRHVLYILTFATPRHAFDLISSISDAQGWMLDNEEREMEAHLAGCSTPREGHDHWSIPRIRSEVTE